MKLFYKLVIMIFIYNLSSISARSTEVPPSLVTDLSKKVISMLQPLCNPSNWSLSQFPWHETTKSITTPP